MSLFIWKKPDRPFPDIIMARCYPLKGGNNDNWIQKFTRHYRVEGLKEISFFPG